MLHGGDIGALKPVQAVATQDEDAFKRFEEEALRLGFTNAACGPMVRSSYHADQQAAQAGVGA